VYSDLVYEQALTNCQYIEHISAKEFKSIRFTPTQAVVVGVKVNGPQADEVNLNTKNFSEAVSKGIENGTVQVFTATKKHEKQRELEMFDWLKKGGYMANADWYSSLIQLL
jgi:hypothetical protein